MSTTKPLVLASAAVVLLASPARAMWPPEGVALDGDYGSHLVQTNCRMRPDGVGGHLVGRTEYVGASRTAAPRVTRVSASGSVVWTTSPVDGSADFVADGKGGAYIATNHPSFGVRLFRVTAVGAPHPALGTSGKLLSTPPHIHYPTTPAVIADDSAGCYVSWTGYGDSGAKGLYVQRVLPNGQIAGGWPLNGVRINPAGTTPENKAGPGCCPTAQVGSSRCGSSSPTTSARSA